MAMPSPVNMTPQKGPSSPHAPFAASPTPQNLLQPQQQQQQQQNHQQRPKRLLILQETKSPALESAYVPINTLGLPIAGPGPYFPDCSTTVSNLPLKVIKSFTEIFNSPRYKNWAVVAAGPYRDVSEDGKFYAVVLEQIRDQSSDSTNK
ncbi:uncharacterized protein TRUGW13939_03129 [Talaromyces rugulosus]|uniref:Uncharacterized protein n=1 Tax=Talaromyces rugulosus TaxID=121627 RepID=A0A7H8QQ92_TALRU|nr:uncharacterized protein TRUGW13939_03129 [Talaromyces rugulosus]QKX56029.1 hypothetical protein TRUGW13939_03129 [Talaromyces rugulosus]